MNKQLQVHVQLDSGKPGIENMKTYYYGSVFLVNDEASAVDSQNVSELVVEKGLDIVLRRNDIKVASNYYDALCTTKSTHSGVDPPVIIDLSNVRITQLFI